MEGKTHYQLFISGCSNETIISLLDSSKTSRLDDYYGPYQLLSAEVYSSLIRGGITKSDIANHYHHSFLWLSERLQGVTLELVESNYTCNRNRLYLNGKMQYHDSNTYHQFVKDVMGIDVGLLCKQYMEVCLLPTS